MTINIYCSNDFGQQKITYSQWLDMLNQNGAPFLDPNRTFSETYHQSRFVPEFQQNTEEQEEQRKLLDPIQQHINNMIRLDNYITEYCQIMQQEEQRKLLEQIQQHINNMIRLDNYITEYLEIMQKEEQRKLLEQKKIAQEKKTLQAINIIQKFFKKQIEKKQIAQEKKQIEKKQIEQEEKTLQEKKTLQAINIIQKFFKKQIEKKQIAQEKKTTADIQIFNNQTCFSLLQNIWNSILQLIKDKLLIKNENPQLSNQVFLLICKLQKEEFLKLSEQDYTQLCNDALDLFLAVSQKNCRIERQNNYTRFCHLAIEVFSKINEKELLKPGKDKLNLSLKLHNDALSSECKRKILFTIEKNDALLLQSSKDNYHNLWNKMENLRNRKLSTENFKVLSNFVVSFLKGWEAHMQNDPHKEHIYQEYVNIDTNFIIYEKLQKINNIQQSSYVDFFSDCVCVSLMHDMMHNFLKNNNDLKFLKFFHSKIDKSYIESQRIIQQMVQQKPELQILIQEFKKYINGSSPIINKIHTYINFFLIKEVLINKTKIHDQEQILQKILIETIKDNNMVYKDISKPEYLNLTDKNQKELVFDLLLILKKEINNEIHKQNLSDCFPNQRGAYFILGTISSVLRTNLFSFANFINHQENIKNSKKIKKLLNQKTKVKIQIQEIQQAISKKLYLKEGKESLNNFLLDIINELIDEKINKMHNNEANNHEFDINTEEKSEYCKVFSLKYNREEIKATIDQHIEDSFNNFIKENDILQITEQEETIEFTEKKAKIQMDRVIGLIALNQIHDILKQALTVVKKNNKDNIFTK